MGGYDARRWRCNASPRFHKNVVGVLQESSAGSEWANGGGVSVVVSSVGRRT
jgi:hypothetical protein